MKQKTMYTETQPDVRYTRVSESRADVIVNKYIGEEEKEKDLTEKVAVLEEANMELTATIDNILTDVIPSLMGI